MAWKTRSSPPDRYRRFASTVLSVCAVAAAVLWPGATALGGSRLDEFVKADGTMFTLGGQPFFVAGVNNHYLTYGTRAEVAGVLDDAAALGANVVRTFLQPVIGSLDGKVATIWDWKSNAQSSDLGVNGTYLLYWDNAAGKMAINSGPTGMEKVDFLIAEAEKRNLRLIVALLDFWPYTGGAQQMRAWYGSAEVVSFFSDRRLMHDYQNWVRYVLQRTNPQTGLRYRDDPTILAWELMNEPNAETDALRLTWTAEMSAFVKSLDPNHLVSSGHANVDSRLADLATPGVDFGTWHGYPLYYRLSVSQFDRRISEFCRLAAMRRKPVLLEEFGYARSNLDQIEAYKRWLATLTHDRNCGGWLVWRLVSRQRDGRYPIDEHDQFDVRNDGGALWNVLKAAAVAATARDGKSRQGWREVLDAIGQRP